LTSDHPAPAHKAKMQAEVDELIKMKKEAAKEEE